MVKVTWTEQALEDFPLSGRVVLEFGREDIREIIFGNYRIIYRVLTREVEILTVHHGARELDSNAFSSTGLWETLLFKHAKYRVSL